MTLQMGTYWWACGATRQKQNTKMFGNTGLDFSTLWNLTCSHQSGAEEISPVAQHNYSRQRAGVSPGDWTYVMSSDASI